MDYKEILDKIARKDKSGLEALYNAYGQKFYFYAAKKWSLSEDDAWDVVYQTLETLILKLPGYTFESGQHFDNFIFKVFVNFLRQHYRKSRKEQFEKINVEIESNIGADPENLTEEGEASVSFEIDANSFNDYYKAGSIENPQLLALEKALGLLDNEERDLLLLRAQNYSYDEIAHMLKIENNQLKVKHHRSKLKLLKLLNANIPKNHV